MRGSRFPLLGHIRLPKKPVLLNIHPQSTLPYPQSTGQTERSCSP